MTAFQGLMDANTVYYLPNGYGAVYYTTPFAIKSKVVGGEQKFYAGQPPYPFELWVQVCGASCAYSESMQGWEISTLNGVDVPSFIKSFSRGGGTYYDDGVRANALIAGFLFGQSSLTLNNMPDETFVATLINPTTSEQVEMTLPFAFGGSASGWSRTAMINANTYSNTKRSHELFAERQLLDALHARAGDLHKRGISSSDSDSQRVDTAITELTMNLERIRVDTLLTQATLRRDGAKALEENRLPFIPSPRERLEDVMRLHQALWNNKANNQTLSETIESHEAPKRRSTLSTNSATEASVIPGDPSKWKMYTTVPSSSPNYFEALPAYCGSYRGTSVLRLASFTTATSYWTESVTNAVNRRQINGLNDNLIIDVTNNGGGSVCLNYHTMSYLVNAWTDLSRVYGEDILYSEYDIRRSDVLASLYENNLLDADAFNTTTGASLGMSYYNNPTSRTIGSGTSSYTQGFNWNPCGTANLYFAEASYHFDKIIVMTDGRCGASCAYFVTQLRENDKVRLVSYGGIYGEPLATSSFAGGNALNWDFLRSTIPGAVGNPYSSYASFNLRANYSPGKYPGTPRQFERLEADWYLPLWDSFFRFYNADNYNTTARFALYESVLPLFDQMPGNLTRIEAPPSPPSDVPLEVPTEAPISNTTSPISAPSEVPTEAPISNTTSPIDVPSDAVPEADSPSTEVPSTPSVVNPLPGAPAPSAASSINFSSSLAAFLLIIALLAISI